MRAAVLISLVLAAAVSAAQVSYDGYKVYQVVPTRNHDLSVLDRFENQNMVDMWTKTKLLNREVDVMVAPAFQNEFTSMLNDNGIAFHVLIDNVENVVNAERIAQAAAPQPRSGRISFDKYHRYDVIREYVAELASTYPDVTVSEMGRSTEDRPIDVVSICRGGECGIRPAIFIECTIHAREWIAPTVCLYAMQELVENPANAAMSASIDWYFVPVLNVDGYEYSHTNSRFWRKTRSKGQICDGVDANRNYDFHWMEVGASANECSETYAGKNAWSEPEVAAERDFIEARKDQIKLYLGMHSYGQLFVYPWGFLEEPPADDRELRTLATFAANAIFLQNSTLYRVGYSTEILYPVSGSSKDWIKGVPGVQLAYTVELPGGGSQGFDLPPERIDGVVKETWQGIKAAHKYIAEKYA